ACARSDSKIMEPSAAASIGRVARLCCREETARAGQPRQSGAATEKIPGQSRTRPWPDTAQAPAQLRDAPVECRGGLAQRAGIAGSRASRYDAGLYPRDDR